MKGRCLVCKVVGLVVIAGALNWGLVGILHKNAVTHFLGEWTRSSRAVYALIGLAGLMLLGAYFRTCPKCQKT